MKRHESLRGLSSEHHDGLVLARGLKTDTPEGLRGQLPSQPAALLDAVQLRWSRDLAPHFAVEERELLPLTQCGEPELRECAARIRREHAQLQAGFGRLTINNLEHERDGLAGLLETHIRYEEKTWFPALEGALDRATLKALAWRLQAEPESIITDYELDENGVWVAKLDCGHGQHVRHNPPIQTASWVMTEAGRADKLGLRLICPLCRMPRLPPCTEVYRETSVMEASGVPDGLKRSHRLRDGSWAQIVILRGHVAYVLEDEDNLTLMLRPGVSGIVAPERPHHVEPQPGSQMKVCFRRCRSHPG